MKQLLLSCPVYFVTRVPGRTTDVAFLTWLTLVSLHRMENSTSSHGHILTLNIHFSHG